MGFPKEGIASMGAMGFSCRVKVFSGEKRSANFFVTCVVVFIFQVIDLQKQFKRQIGAGSLKIETKDSFGLFREKNTHHSKTKGWNRRTEVLRNPDGAYSMKHYVSSCKYRFLYLK